MTDQQEQFFERCYREQFARLKVYAHAHQLNWEEAEELVQDTFHTAWEKIDAFTASDNPMGWLVNTLKFKLYNRERKRQRQAQLFLRFCMLAPPPAAEEPPDDSLNHFCQQVLSPSDYYALRRIVLEDATYAQLSEELGISLWTCRKRVQRILKKLRRQMEKSGWDAP